MHNRRSDLHFGVEESQSDSSSVVQDQSHDLAMKVLSRLTVEEQRAVNQYFK